MPHLADLIIVHGLDHKFWIEPSVFHAGMAKNLQPLTVLVVHQKQGHTVVHGDVAGAQQLSIPLVVGEGQSRLVDNPRKSRGPSTMLNVRLPAFAD